MNEADYAAAARRNRESMPRTAALLDEFRRVFGPGCRITWAREGDREVGKRAAPERYMNADEWLHYLKTGERPARGA